MRRNENAEDRNVNARNDDSRGNLQFLCRRPAFRNNGDSIDDDLHEKLYFEDIGKENEEKNDRSVFSSEPRPA